MQPTEEEIGIGDGQRATLSVASWTGMCTSRLGADVEYLVPVSKNGPAPRRDRVDIQLRYLDGDTSSGSLKDMLVLSAESRNVGGLGSAKNYYKDHSLFHPCQSLQQVILRWDRMMSERNQPHHPLDQL